MMKRIKWGAILLIPLILSGCSQALDTRVFKNAEQIINVQQYEVVNLSTEKPHDDIPINYKPWTDEIFAVLDENNEITGYKKRVVDGETEKWVLCDGDGNELPEPPPESVSSTTEPPQSEPSLPQETTSQTPEPTKPAVILPNKITLNQSDISLYVGNTSQLKPGISPSNATDKKIAWSSNNKEVASVNSSGLVKGIKKGTATITVVTSNGHSASCKITVNEVTQPTEPSKPEPTVPTQEAFAWSVIAQSSCPLNVSNKFDQYVLKQQAVETMESNSGYTYILIKAVSGKGVKVSNVSESVNTINISYGVSGSENYQIIRINRTGKSITFNK